MAAPKKLTVLLVIASTSVLGFISTVVGQTCGPNVPVSTNVTVQYLTSAGYPSNYSNNMDCQWIITSDRPTMVVVLKLLDFQLESNCSNDNVTIYDGDGASSTKIATLCGKAPQKEYASSGLNMTVVFHSDSNNTFQGFRFQYTTAPVTSAITANANFPLIKGSSGNISSINYSNGSYPSNATSQYLITTDVPENVVVLKLLDFEIESSANCIFDYVKFFDGPTTSSPILGTLCGTLPSGLVTSSGPAMTVFFQSDLSNNFKGYRLGISPQNKTAACSSTFLSGDATVQYLTSTNYPGGYSNNMDCQWIITSEGPSKLVVLKLLDFQLESNCSKDYVTIYDGYGTSSTKIATLCGEAPEKEYVSSGSNMTVVFHSDSSNNFKGFRFLYTTAWAKSYVSESSMHNLYLGTSAVISSLYDSKGNYPSNSTSNYSITTHIPGYVIALKLLEFVIEPSLGCTFDNMTIYDGSNTNSPILGTLCGTLKSGQLTSSGPAMTVFFQSDLSNNYKGYKLGISSQNKTASCSSGVLKANSTATSLNSPNYPYQYPSTVDCQWLISANSSSDVVELTLKDFNLNGEKQQCLNDYVKIYDGPSNSSHQIIILCGQYSDGTFNSTGSQMTIAFHSDGVHNNTKSFSFTYKSKNSAGILAAAQMSILPLILLIYQLLY
jgi:cubilin